MVIWSKDLRDNMWQDIIAINPINFSVYMDNLNSLTFTAEILSCNTDFELDSVNEHYFSDLCVQHTKTICSSFYTT